MIGLVESIPIACKNMLESNAVKLATAKLLSFGKLLVARKATTVKTSIKVIEKNPPVTVFA